MGRPRRPYNGVEDVAWSANKWLVNEVPGLLKARQGRRWEASTHWKYVAKNGLYDPLTFLFVLDAVANINPDIELRSKNLVEFLQRERDQFHWDVTTVGRVLNGIREAFEDVLGEKRGILEAGVDYRGAFYRIHHNAETAALYYRAREDLMRLAENEMTLRALGKHSKEMVSPLTDCPSLRVGFEVAV